MTTVLEAHNRHRATHCSPPLAWSSELAAVATRWAESLRDAGCAFEHSRSSYGENLAAGTTGALTPQSVVDMWYQEVGDYQFSSPGFAMSTGHFTQLVWSGTRHLGCGTAQCPGAVIWVCNYDPPGNVQGAFQGNVQPTGCATR